MSDEVNTTEEQIEIAAAKVENTPQSDELIAEELSNTSASDVAAGEAPAEEANTPNDLPVMIHEDSRPVEAPEAPLESTPEPSENQGYYGVPGETGNADLVGHNGSLADYNVAHEVVLDQNATANQADVIAGFQLPTQEVPVPNSFEKYIQEVTITGTSAEQSIITVVDMYLSKMRPRMPTGIQEGAAAQVMLWRSLLNTIQRNPAEFKSLWSMWLMYFNHYSDGVFGTRYVFRFMEFVQLPKNQVVAFQRILNLLIRTANPVNRAAVMRHVDLEATMSVYFTEADRQRVIGFYKG